MRRLPNLMLLKTFEAAARLQSFAAAADELHLTPSAISHQIRELEQYFGTSLFVRRNRGVRPTFEGQRLAASLGNMFSALEASCSELAAERSYAVLSVHCPPSFGLSWLTRQLPRFAQAHPTVQLRLDTSARIVDLIADREVDVEIRYGRADRQPGVAYHALGTEDVVPLCSPDLAKRCADPFEVMKEIGLIESRWSHVTWLEWFTLNGLNGPDEAPKVRHSFDRGAMAISAAAGGMGIALESKTLAQEEIRSGALVELGQGLFQPVNRPAHFLAYREHERDTPKIGQFRTWLLQRVCEEGRMADADVVPFSSRSTPLPRAGDPEGRIRRLA
ncbi:MAG: LysR substrate-binding domain-containing protein [Lautropia sp.]